MIPTLANVLSVAIGAFLGMLTKGIPERLKNAIMNMTALSILYLAINGCSLKGGNTLLIVFALVGGVIIGEVLDLDGLVTRGGEMLEKHFAKDTEGEGFIKGFVSGSTIFCVGAMAVVGSVQAGLGLGGETIYAKSVMDFVVAVILGGNYGVGVVFSALFVLVFQGGIVALAGFIAPFLTEAAILSMNFVGSCLLIGVGTNMLGITKIKMMNTLPGIFLAMILAGWF